MLITICCVDCSIYIFLLNNTQYESHYEDHNHVLFASSPHRSQAEVGTGVLNVVKFTTGFAARKRIISCIIRDLCDCSVALIGGSEG
jgi:hypothetical protein